MRLTLTDDERLRRQTAVADLHDAVSNAGDAIGAKIEHGVRRVLEQIVSDGIKAARAARRVWQRLRRLSPAVRRAEAEQRALAALLGLDQPFLDTEVARAARQLVEHMSAGIHATGPVLQRCADAFRAMQAAVEDESLALALECTRACGQPLTEEQRAKDARLLERLRTCRPNWLRQAMHHTLLRLLPLWRFKLALDDAGRTERGLPLFPLARVHAVQQRGNPQEASAGE